MRLDLMRLLACPKCKRDLVLKASKLDGGGEILSGVLRCDTCQKDFPIENKIPRFVPCENYASSFGFQWNLFRSEQLDSRNGTKLSEERFFNETNWSKDELRGQWVLDVGCGAGRFLEIGAAAGANVVGIDISDAVDAASNNLSEFKNAHFVQASVYELPFRDDTFEKIYCIGVLQHTPDPLQAVHGLSPLTKSGGQIAITAYEKKYMTKFHAKYIIRPITKRMNKERLLNIIKSSMFILFPMTNILFRVPIMGKVFERIIPVANYIHENRLTKSERYDWAIMDTFDMLSPRFDRPLAQPMLERALRETGVYDIRRLPNPGLNLVGNVKA